MVQLRTGLIQSKLGHNRRNHWVTNVRIFQAAINNVSSSAHPETIKQVYVAFNDGELNKSIIWNRFSVLLPNSE